MTNPSYKDHCLIWLFLCVLALYMNRVSLGSERECEGVGERAPAVMRWYDLISCFQWAVLKRMGAETVLSAELWRGRHSRGCRKYTGICWAVGYGTMDNARMFLISIIQCWKKSPTLPPSLKRSEGQYWFLLDQYRDIWVTCCKQILLSKDI